MGDDVEHRDQDAGRGEHHVLAGGVVVEIGDLLLSEAVELVGTEVEDDELRRSRIECPVLLAGEIVDVLLDVLREAGEVGGLGGFVVGVVCVQHSGERYFGIDEHHFVARQVDPHVGALTIAVGAGGGDLFVEIDAGRQARDLDHPLERLLAPRAANLWGAEGLRETQRLFAQ